MTGATLVPPVGDADHADGPRDAPVTLVEYGDYECTYCGAAYPIVQALRRDLAGRLRFAFRNFPLREAHPHAEHAAEAAEAVAHAGGDLAFWKMHDALYEHQDALDDASLARYAGVAGVDGKEVLAALEEQTFARKVRSDFNSGVRSGVNGTPTFFINGQRFDGNWEDSNEFAAALDAAASGRDSGR